LANGAAHVTAATIALIARIVHIRGGMVGLLYDKLLPEHQVSDETRALIDRVTGFVATMAALVLGLLIVSANTFYNSQRGANPGKQAVAFGAGLLSLSLGRCEPISAPYSGAAGITR
jgi:hypothetical protein